MRKKLWVRAAAFAALLAAFILRPPCPIRLIFGVNCPTCGVTRALYSLLSLDFAAYLKYNFTALPLAAIALIYIFCDSAEKSRRFNAFAVIISALNFIRYIVSFI